MKKLFLMALVALMSLQSFAQTQETDSITYHKIIMDIPVSVGLYSDKFHTRVSIPDDHCGLQVVQFDVYDAESNSVKTLTKSLIYEEVDNGEVMHNLNRGVKVFANCEVVATVVSLATAGLTVGLLCDENNPHTKAATIVGIGGASIATILHIIGIVNLCDKSMKNLYVSDKGVGFKIDIK